MIINNLGFPSKKEKVIPSLSAAVPQFPGLCCNMYQNYMYFNQQYNACIAFHFYKSLIMEYMFLNCV